MNIESLRMLEYLILLYIHTHDEVKMISLREHFVRDYKYYTIRRAIYKLNADKHYIKLTLRSVISNGKCTATYSCYTLTEKGKETLDVFNSLIQAASQ